MWPFWAKSTLARQHLNPVIHVLSILTLKFHSSEVTFSSCPAPAFPAASVCYAEVPWVPEVLQLAVMTLTPACTLTDTVSDAVQGLLPPESPVMCKSTHVQRACLINSAGSLSRGSAILLSNCSAFCLMFRMLILFFFFFPLYLKQIKDPLL